MCTIPTTSFQNTSGTVAQDIQDQTAGHLGTINDQLQVAQSLIDSISSNVHVQPTDANAVNTYSSNNFDQNTSFRSQNTDLSMCGSSQVTGSHFSSPQVNDSDFSFNYVSSLNQSETFPNFASASAASHTQGYSSATSKAYLTFFTSPT